MKKKAVIFATAAALVLSLAACGNQGSGNNDHNDGAGGSTTGTQDNGTPGGTSGQGGDNNSGGTANNGGVTNNSGTTGTTGNNGANGSGGFTSGTTGSTTRGRSTLGGGIRDAVDDAGRAVDDLVDDVTGQHRADNMTSFERMLDNARVHDVDGVLTDGENANW